MPKPPSVPQRDEITAALADMVDKVHAVEAIRHVIERYTERGGDPVHALAEIARIVDPLPRREFRGADVGLKAGLIPRQIDLTD